MMVSDNCATGSSTNIEYEKIDVCSVTRYLLLEGHYSDKIHCRLIVVFGAMTALLDKFGYSMLPPSQSLPSTM